MEFLQYKKADNNLNGASAMENNRSNLNGFQFTNNFSSPTPSPILPQSQPNYQLKVTPNNEIYISNESGSFCELAGNLYTNKIAGQEQEQKQLFYIKNGDKKPIFSSEHLNSGIFRSKECVSAQTVCEKAAKTNVVISKSLNNGIIVPKKYLNDVVERSPEELSRARKRKSVHVHQKTDYNLNYLHNGLNEEQQLPTAESNELNFQNYHQNEKNRKRQLGRRTPPRTTFKNSSPTEPAFHPPELQVITGLIMDQNNGGHISLVNNISDIGKTVIYQNSDSSTNVLYSILNPNALNLNVVAISGSLNSLTSIGNCGDKSKVAKKGKKKGGTTKKGVSVEVVKVKQEPVLKTRSGRLSKPPKHVNNFFQNIKNTNKIEDNVGPNHKHLNGHTDDNNPQVSDENKRKITIPTQYRCSTCNKIYLGKSRMAKHLQQYPDHNNATTKPVEDEDEVKSRYLYQHLLELLHKIKEKDKGRILLKEISHFVDTIKELIPRLITNDEENSSVEYIDRNVADVLQLNHGNYRLNMSHLSTECEQLNQTNTPNIFNFSVEENLVQNCHNFNASINKSFGMLSTPLNLY